MVGEVKKKPETVHEQAGDGFSLDSPAVSKVQRNRTRFAWVFALGIHACGAAALFYMPAPNGQGGLYETFEEDETLPISSEEQPEKVRIPPAPLVAKTSQKPEEIAKEEVEAEDEVLPEPEIDGNEEINLPIARRDSVKVDEVPAVITINPDEFKEEAIAATPNPEIDSTSLAKGDSIVKPVQRRNKTRYAPPGPPARTLRRVRKVYPLALEAQTLLSQLRSELDTLPKNSQQRKLIKSYERALLDRYIDTAKSMTTSEGVILVKLIARETGYTPYELIKDYRGGAKATAFQLLAQIYKVDLKEEYDSIKDPSIEESVKLIEKEMREKALKTFPTGDAKNPK